MSCIERKYEITSESKEVKFFTGKIERAATVYRIRAVRDFGNVKKGELGGFVQDYSNLSHDGECWITDDAVVCKCGEVKDNALVYENALVLGTVYENAHVGGHAHIGASATIFGNASVGHGVYERNNKGVCVVGSAEISGCAQVFGSAYIKSATVCGYAHVGENARLERRGGYLTVRDDIFIGGNARIFTNHDYIWIPLYDETCDVLRKGVAAYRTSDGGVTIFTEMFRESKFMFTIEEFRKLTEYDYVGRYRAALADFIEAYMKEHEEKWVDRRDNY
jgi:hypothetical protein